MSNLVKSNVVLSSTDKSELRKCIDTIVVDGVFSLNNFLPMPTELDIENSTLEKKGICVLENKLFLGSEVTFRDMAERAKAIEIGRKAIANKKEFGFYDWYDWRCKYWGCKRDVVPDELYMMDKGEEFHLGIETDWTTPKSFFIALSEKFPNVRIDVEYADENCVNNCGIYRLIGGELIKDVEIEDDEEFGESVWDLEC